MSEAERKIEAAKSFSAGNYASAYEAMSLETALKGKHFSDEGKAAFIIGYFASHEVYEVPSHELEEFTTAHRHPVAGVLYMLGYTDDRTEKEVTSA